MNKQQTIKEILIILTEYIKYSDIELEYLKFNEEYAESQEYRDIIKKILRKIRRRGFINAILDVYPEFLILLSIYQFRKDHPIKYYWLKLTNPAQIFISHYERINDSIDFYKELHDVCMYYEVTNEQPRNTSKVANCFQRIFDKLENM